MKPVKPVAMPSSNTIPIRPSTFYGAIPIQIPSNKDLPKPAPPIKRYASQPQYEFDVANGISDPFMSQADAQKALQDLVSEAYNEVDQPVSVEDATVEGFSEDTTLLPHQVLGRKWMAERETGKKNGGILADDMGYVQSQRTHFVLSLTISIIFCSLGKTIQTLTRIVEGRPTKEDRQEGYAKTTLYVKLFKSPFFVILSPLNIHS